MYWLDNCPGASEDIDEGLPESRGHPLKTNLSFKSDHAHDQVTRQLVSGGICFVGSTPIGWSSKIQGAIKTSSYSVEFCAGRVATE